MYRPNTDDVAVTELVSAAKGGDERAWEMLVSRYQPLICSVARRFRLSGPDAADVCQTVWLQIVKKLGQLREPLAFPGWIETTAANVCMTLLKDVGRSVPQGSRISHYLDVVSFQERPPHRDEIGEHLIWRENCQAVHRAIAELPRKEQEFLLLLMVDPPLSYKQISERLGMPVGSIGPTRARCLEKLRWTKSLRTLMSSGDSMAA